MKITIEANFRTDGDYHIEGYDYSKILNESEDIILPDRSFKIHTKTWNSHLFDEDYDFYQEFECEDADYCKIYARSYLEELLCNIRILSTHYYIMPYFYEMFDNAIKSIGREKHFYECIGGNYDGTDLEICTID